MEVFTLPESWTELSFPEATQRVRSKGVKIKAGEYKSAGRIPIVDQGKKLVAGFTDDEDVKFQGPLPIIVFGDHTREVKFVDFDFAVGADGTVLLKPDSRIEPRFFYYWLKSATLHNLGYSRHFKLLAEQVVRFPVSLIVGRVEKLISHLDTARRVRQAAIAEADVVFQRVLENEFNDDATEDWREVPAEKLFELVSGQASPLDPQFKHLPYLGPEHVESGTGRIIGERVSVEKLEMKSGKYVFSPEHVVYSKIRPALRKVCLPDYHGLCSADMYALKPNADEVTREFLLFLLLAPAFSQYAVEKSDRNAMPKINQTALFDFTFRVPDKPEQKRIAKFLLTLRGKLDELQRLQREVAAELASFTPALLAKAFRGEL